MLINSKHQLMTALKITKRFCFFLFLLNIKPKLEGITWYSGLNALSLHTITKHETFVAHKDSPQVRAYYCPCKTSLKEKARKFRYHLMGQSSKPVILSVKK